MKWFSRDGMTTDDVVFFEVNDGDYYAPSAEPEDLVQTGYKNHGDTVENKKILKAQVAKYNLSHLLYGA